MDNQQFSFISLQIDKTFSTFLKIKPEAHNENVDSFDKISPDKKH